MYASYDTRLTSWHRQQPGGHRQQSGWSRDIFHHGWIFNHDRVTNDQHEYNRGPERVRGIALSANRSLACGNNSTKHTEHHDSTSQRKHASAAVSELTCLRKSGC